MQPARPAYSKLMARRRFFVDAVQSGRARITGPDAHHLTRVLRVEPGSSSRFPIITPFIWPKWRERAQGFGVVFDREKIAPVQPVVLTTVLASLNPV